MGKMKSFAHHNAKSAKEAASLLAKNKGKAKVYAGGTDILGILKDNILPENPEYMINLKTAEGMDLIKEDKQGITIGALAKLADIAGSPVIRENYRLLSEAARSVATPNIRNMATIGGNLAQDVRCWYYRYSEQIGGPIKCLRKGGKLCNALSGDNRYHSIFGAALPLENPCRGNCPAHTDIPLYLGRLRSGDLEGAARTLLSFNPFPAVTGRVCPVFCEENCNRSGFDEPVAINCVERSLGDYILGKAEEFYAPPKTKSGRKIAIAGAGPAGLSAAYFLRMSGHSVTVFDRLPEPGGMLSYGIPPYRLSKSVIKKQINALKKMGIDFKVSTGIGKDISITKLASDYSAVFLSAGAWKEKPLGIKGEEHAISGLDFLNKVNSGLEQAPGRRIAVIGGGNTAMDVARTLLRMGAEPVVIYRRSRNEMPALAGEVEKAAEEGVKFEFLTMPKDAVSKDGAISLICTKMKLGKADSSGRPKAVPVAGSDFTLNFDAVMKAVGEEPDLSLLTPALKNNMGAKPASPVMISKNIVAGGDFVTGPSTVIQAITAGRDGAAMIEGFIAGISGKQGKSPALQPAFSAPSFAETPRYKNYELHEEGKPGLYAEDEPGMDISRIGEEAGRCFNCGCLAVAPSDMGTALVALNADIITSKRTIGSQDFFRPTATASNVLEPEEIITEIRIPKPPEGSRQSYIKFTLRKPVDFAIVNVASMITINNGVCGDSRIVLGAVAPSPVRAYRAEEFLRGRPADENSAQKAGELALEGSLALNANEYKIQIARTLVKRAILGVHD